MEDLVENCVNCGCPQCICPCHVFNNAAILPLGFKYEPSDIDLVNEYLIFRITGGVIPAIHRVWEHDVYSAAPDQLLAQWAPVVPGVWLFLSPRRKLSLTSNRINRRAGAGEWKTKISTSKKHIVDQGIKLAEKNTLVFMDGNRQITGFTMHEYVAALNQHVQMFVGDLVVDEIVLYKIFHNP